MTALVAPRPLLLTYNAHDECCFVPDDVLPNLKLAAEGTYRLYGHLENLRTHINLDPGTHNFQRDNREALYGLIGDNFYRHDPTFPKAEMLISDAEILSANQLAVPLPAGNATLHGLGLELSQTCPDVPDWPGSVVAFRPWQAELRERLRGIIKLPNYTCREEPVEQISRDGYDVKHRRLRIGDLWTLPLVELGPTDATSSVLVISDLGRGDVSEFVNGAVGKQQRVFAVDLLGFGEAGLHVADGKHDDIALHLAATIGKRPLGIQAAQLISVVNWLQSLPAEYRPTIVARGPRSCVIALVAAALEPAMRQVELLDSWGSLHELVQRNMSLEEAPELFCFGLLKTIDIPELIALMAPRRVTVHPADERTVFHLARLATWYRLFGEDLFQIDSATAGTAP